MERQISTTPIAIPRTRRRDEWRGLTSCKAGVIVPIAYFPLLREDSIRGSLQVQVRMAEAVATIINPVRVTLRADLVPKSALARFEGSMETLNRSYAGVATLPGGSATPAWFVRDDTVDGLGDDDKGHQIYDGLGIHYKSTSWINDDLIKSYWRVVNWRRAAVSQALAELPPVATYAPAFWDSWKFDMIKPSFDAAMMEGVVPVGIDGTVPVTGVTVHGTGLGATDSTLVAAQLGNNFGGAGSTSTYVNISGDGGQSVRVQHDGVQGAARLRANLASAGASISLANIAMANQSMRFAKLREEYQGIPDEYLIELLMQGIRVPPEDFREPVLLGRASAVIGQSEQYATDGASLDQSVTRGLAQLSLPFATPAINPGGIVLITAEIVPEQLYERVGDSFLAADAVADLPDALADYLDPQKVEMVPNKYADQFHSDPEGVFGYAPLNYEWQRSFARVGGKYKRPVPDAFVENRQRIWSVEKADPSLSDDFYVCPQPFPHTVFADAASDPFEIITIGQAVLTGLTQFGAGFEEDGDHYEKIIAQVDAGRISSVPAAQALPGQLQDDEPEVSEGGDSDSEPVKPEPKGKKQ